VPRPTAGSRNRETPLGFPPVRVLTGLAFELVAELAAFTSGPARTALDAGKPWVREVRRRAGPELITQVERYDLNIYGQLATVALEAPEPRDVASLIRKLQRLEPDVLHRRLLGADSQMNRAMVGPDAFERALAGHAEARAELRSEMAGGGAAGDAFLRVLDSTPSAIKQEVLGIVGDWADRVLPGLAAAAWAAIDRDARAKEAQLATRTPQAVIEMATHGVSYEPPTWIREAVLVPTVALRPFVVPVELREIVLFLYPVADDALGADAAAPPRRLVKVAAALGDELRLRILHALGNDELSASEIAERLAVDRTTIHHHLGILRSAGLLTIRDEGVRGWRYTRRADGVAVAAELDAYLGSS
jgi:DNA-binding transcriptional ArsR family regulator